MEKIKVCQDRFVDAKGRHVILSGINFVFKGEKINGKMNYYPTWGEKEFALFKQAGFNVVRLGLIWDAVEPEPGVYDEKYLAWVGSMLDLCEKYKIYAFLDMHQDLYSVLYSDGAPEWATLTDGLPHIEGDLWSDAYLFSEAVKRAFDNFWANAPVAGGMGLQDHYTKMWVHIAKLFKDHPALIGYDFMNEPFPGSAATEIFGALMGALAHQIGAAEGKRYSVEEMISLFSDQQEKLKILAHLENKELYLNAASMVEPLVAQFDQGALANFYNKVAQAVRQIDPDGIIMRENSYFSNIGIQCRAPHILSVSGKPDPNQAYSPHGYDLVVDTEAVVIASNKRVDVIFDAHRRTQEELGVPVLVGEWGAHSNYQEGLEHIEHLLAIFDQNLWSNTYWCYYDGFAAAPVLNVLKRPYPQAVNGKILKYHYDRKANTFFLEWEEKGGKAPTLVYLPHTKFSLELEGAYDIKEEKNSVLLVIPPLKGRRTLKVEFN